MMRKETPTQFQGKTIRRSEDRENEGKHEDDLRITEKEIKEEEDETEREKPMRRSQILR